MFFQLFFRGLFPSKYFSLKSCKFTEGKTTLQFFSRNFREIFNGSWTLEHLQAAASPYCTTQQSAFRKQILCGIKNLSNKVLKY